MERLASHVADPKLGWALADLRRQQLQPQAGGTRRLAKLVVLMIMAGLLLAASAGFIALKVRSHVDFAQKTRDQFRQLDTAFDGVRLPGNYVLVHEGQAGSAYPAPLNDTAPTVVRTFQVTHLEGIPEDLMKVLRDQGFNVGAPYGCFFEATRGRVHLFIDYAGEPKPKHGGGLQCPNPIWKTVTAEITLLLD